MIARGPRRHLWIGCLALALVSGCGGPSSYDDFRDQLASRYCDYLVRCGVLGASETGQCPAPPELGTATTTNLDIDAALADNTIAFHGGRAQRCLDELKSLPCNFEQANADLFRYCHAIVEPKLGDGESCVDDVQCLNGACSQQPIGCGGSCVTYAPTGGSCLNTAENASTECDPTVHYCDEMTSTCKLLVQSGGKCSDDTQCAFSLACVGGKCITSPRLVVGQTCGTGLPPCADGLVCTAKQVCAARIGSGGVCDSVDECKDGLACVNGACAAWSDIGRACAVDTTGFGSGCPADQTCTNSVCAAIGAPVAGPGRTCSTSVACAAGLWCNNGACTYQKGLGGSCSGDSECATGFSCDTTTTQKCIIPTC
jgi:hypothetical protein